MCKKTNIFSNQYTPICRFQSLGVYIGGEWPNCKTYQANIKGRFQSGELKMDSDLNPLFDQLESDIRNRANKLQDKYLVELKVIIETVIKDKQNKVKELAGYLTAKNYDIMPGLTRDNVIQVYIPRTRHYDKKEQFVFLVSMCNTVIEQSWDNVGGTDQKIKLEITKLGYPVKNRYDYDEIKQEMDDIVNGMNKTLTTLNAMHNFGTAKEFLLGGRLEILHHFRGPVDKFFQRITKWQSENHARATRLVDPSEEFQFLMVQVNADVNVMKEEITTNLATKLMATSNFCCQWQWQMRLSQPANVVDCLERDVRLFRSDLKMAMDKTVYRVAGVNRNLESMGQ